MPADARAASEEIRLRHGLAGRDEQAAELIDRIVYQAEGAALAHRHHDLHGFLYWAYGLFQDVRALAPIARDMRDAPEGRS